MGPADGKRANPGISLAPRETTWRAFLTSLVERGLPTAKFIVSDPSAAWVQHAMSFRRAFLHAVPGHTAWTTRRPGLNFSWLNHYARLLDRKLHGPYEHKRPRS